MDKECVKFWFATAPDNAMTVRVEQVFGETRQVLWELIDATRDPEEIWAYGELLAKSHDVQDYTVRLILYGVD